MCRKAYISNNDKKDSKIKHVFRGLGLIKIPLIGIYNNSSQEHSEIYIYIYVFQPLKKL